MASSRFGRTVRIIHTVPTKFIDEEVPVPPSVDSSTTSDSSDGEKDLGLEDFDFMKTIGEWLKKYLGQVTSNRSTNTEVDYTLVGWDNT